MNSTVLSKNEIKELISIRHYLHANPELSEEEHNTADFIAKELKNYSNCEVVTNIGGTGVLAIFSGESDGETILFRCELDALPIKEINEFSYKSKVDNVSHKCGHDGHIAILLGLAKVLSKQKSPKGKIVLLFQPAEEVGLGAKAVLNDIKFSKIRPDYVFALHNWPGIESKQIMYSNNIFTASVKSVIIKLRGLMSHASQPEKGNNPALAVAKILQMSEKLSVNNVNSENMQLITPTYVKMGQEAYGISPGEAEIYLTFRTWTNERMKTFQAEIKNEIDAIAHEYNLQHSLNWTNEFAANTSHIEAVQILKKVSNALSLTLTETKGIRGGEDFGLFTEKFKGTMFGLGAGVEHAPLHSNDYDFPDELIEVGVSLFYEIYNEVLGH